MNISEEKDVDMNESHPTTTTTEKDPVVQSDDDNQENDQKPQVKEVETKKKERKHDDNATSLGQVNEVEKNTAETKKPEKKKTQKKRKREENDKVVKKQKLTRYTGPIFEQKIIMTMIKLLNKKNFNGAVFTKEEFAHFHDRCENRLMTMIILAEHKNDKNIMSDMALLRSISDQLVF